MRFHVLHGVAVMSGLLVFGAGVGMGQDASGQKPPATTGPGQNIRQDQRQQYDVVGDLFRNLSERPVLSGTRVVPAGASISTALLVKNSDGQVEVREPTVGCTGFGPASAQPLGPLGTWSSLGNSNTPAMIRLDNNIKVSDRKFVDPFWIKQQLLLAAKALEGTSALNASTVAAQLGTLQGLTSQNSDVNLQLSASGGKAPSPATPPTPLTSTLPGSGLSSTQLLTREIELNSQYLIYQALYKGLASDNLVIGTDGQLIGNRGQVTIAFPVNVAPFEPYKGAVAEVRVFMIPRMGKKGSLSLANLLPESRSYNVARASTNSKQFGAGVALEAINVGFSTGKSKNTQYIAKDSDTLAFESQTPLAGTDIDVRSSFKNRFRYLLPVGGCTQTSQKAWKDAELNPTNNYDLERAITFGWQFRPVLGDQSVQPMKSLLFAQVALDDSTDVPALYVETRWRAYDRRTGVVGEVYPDSCTWERLSDVILPNYQSKLADIESTDAGGGSLKIKAKGVFADPNLQVRIGKSMSLPDFVSADAGELDIFLPAATVIASSGPEVVGTNTNPLPLIKNTNAGKSCSLQDVQVEGIPFSDGTTLVNVNMTYGSDREFASEKPLMLFAGDVYGMQEHPFKKRPVNPTETDFQFVTKLSTVTANPSIVVKDVDWSETSVATAIKMGPTFSSLKQIAPDKTTGATPPATPPTASSTSTAPAKFAAGVYRLTGTGFSAIAPDRCVDPDQVCLALASSSAPDTSLEVDGEHLKIQSDTVARLRLEKDTLSPLLVTWTNHGVSSEWTLEATPTAPAPEPKIGTTTVVHVGDSGLAVVFTGHDFRSIMHVTFDNSEVKILANDEKSITVSIPSKAVKTAGSKGLVATGADGKSVLLPLVVSAR